MRLSHHDDYRCHRVSKHKHTHKYRNVPANNRNRFFIYLFLTFWSRWIEKEKKNLARHSFI